MFQETLAMKRKQRAILFMLVFILFLSSCTLNREEPNLDPPTEEPAAPPASEETPATEENAQTQPTAPPAQPELDSDAQALGMNSAIAFVPGQALVKFKPEVLRELPIEKRSNVQGLAVGSASLDPTFEQLGITSLEPVLAAPASAMGRNIATLNTQSGPLNQLYIAEFDAGKDVSAVASQLQNNAQIEFAEPNFVAFATDEPALAPRNFTPNDPFLQYQWGLQAIQAEQAWDKSRGAGVIIAVLDTGVAYEDFESFRRASDLAPGQFVAGYDFVNNDSHPNDDQGHGTHVAGTLAQTTNNGTGVAGVAFEARLMPVKILDQQGRGSYSAIIQGINFAVNQGAKIINMSLAGNSPSQAMEDAIRQAKSQGVTIVAAAGNNGRQEVGFPAAYDDLVIGVGAIRQDRSRASYSNYGPQIDIVAPGGDNRVDQNNDGFGDGIVQQTFREGSTTEFSYRFFEGTSMATPHVSGVAALLLSKNGGLSPDQIEGFLTSTAQDLGPAGFDNEYGAGLIQAYAALLALEGGGPTPTATPTSSVPTPTATPPTGNTPTPTATPFPAGNILKNSSFEVDEAWHFPHTKRPGSYSNAVVHSGSRSALVGIINAADDTHTFSSVAQKVTIPADVTQATLRAFIYPVSQNMGSTDLQIISVLNEYFTEIHRLHNDLSNANAWQEKTFDLTKYRGRTIYVYFDVVNRVDNNLTTAMYVDDVTLEITR
jgi:serine protease